MVRVAGTQDGRELQFWEFFTKLGRAVDLQGAVLELKSVRYSFCTLCLWGHVFICNLLLPFAFSGKSETLFLSYLNKISKPWLTPR